MSQMLLFKMSAAAAVTTSCALNSHFEPEQPSAERVPPPRPNSASMYCSLARAQTVISVNPASLEAWCLSGSTL